MSYDLGYEYGYESDWEWVPAKPGMAAEPGSSTAVYRMNGGPGAARPGSPEWIRQYMEMAGLGGSVPPVGGDPGTVGGTGGGTPNPPPGTGDPTASGALGSMGAVPADPGTLPAAVPEGTPSMTLAEMQAARGTDANSRWSPIETELRDRYGFSDAEIAAFERQYPDPTTLRSGEPPVLPPALPSDAPRLQDMTGAARIERSAAATAIRRRATDDMVHDLGGTIHGMFAEGEISRDSADAMAAQMYRRAGVNPDANPPLTLDRMAAVRARPAGGGPSPISRELSSLRGPSYRPPDPHHPERGLHRADTHVRPLFDETVSHYRTAAGTTLAPLFGNVPGRGNYYANTGPGRTHRSEDAQMYLTHRNIDSDPGALRGISRTEAPPHSGTGPRPPHPLQSEVETFSSTLRTTGTNALTPMGSALSTRIASDPTRAVDTSGLNAADRSGLTRGRAERRDAEEIAIRTEGRAEGTRIREEGRAEGRDMRREGREMNRSLTMEAARHELQMRQQHDQQVNQLMQNMVNHGMQMTQSQINMLNNLTTDQLRSINQTTTALLQSGSPRPFDIVAQMLSGGSLSSRR